VKLADIDTLVWLIIALVVVVAKGWNKLQGQIDKDTSESKGVPPGAPARSKPQQPRPQRQAAPAGARPVAAPMRRSAQPMRRTATRTAPAPVGSPTARNTWRVDPEQVRRFMEQLSGQARPVSPPPVAPPPVRQVEALAPHTPPAEPEPALAAPVIEAAQTSAPSPSFSRAAQWAAALRDRQNVRNIIISYEIIGPPKAV